jgi:hypothetical protein
MDLKTSLDQWSSQLHSGLQERDVEKCMEAIKHLKELGANVTFSLAAGEGQEQPGYQQYPQGEAGQYPGGGQPPYAPQ